jgi:hypothetical protein
MQINPYLLDFWEVPGQPRTALLLLEQETPTPMLQFLTPSSREPTDLIIVRWHPIWAVGSVTSFWVVGAVSSFCTKFVAAGVLPAVS